MIGIDDDDSSVIEEFECDYCGEEIKLIHVKEKYMTVKSTAYPALLGGVGYSAGGYAGIAALGTAISASWPLATVLAMLGGSAVYIAGDTKDSLQCPACEAGIDP